MFDQSCIIMLFLGCLIYITWRDMKDQTISNGINLLCFILSICWRLITHQSLTEGLIVAGLVLILLLSVDCMIMKVIHTTGLGGGDIKLLAVMGLWFGDQMSVLEPSIPVLGLFIILACLLQIPFNWGWQLFKQQTPCPFGPMLGLSFTIIFSIENIL